MMVANMSRNSCNHYKTFFQLWRHGIFGEQNGGAKPEAGSSFSNFYVYIFQEFYFAEAKNIFSAIGLERE
jgi:hypothetical protein